MTPGSRAEQSYLSALLGTWLDELERTGNDLLGAFGRRGLRAYFHQYVAAADARVPPEGSLSACSRTDLEEAASSLEASLLALGELTESAGPLQAAVEALSTELRRAAWSTLPPDPVVSEVPPERPTRVLWEITLAIQNALTPAAVARALTEGALRLCQASSVVWWRRQEGGLLEAAVVSGAPLPEAARAFQARAPFWQPHAPHEQRAVIVTPTAPESAAWLDRVGASCAVLLQVPDAGHWSGVVSVHDGALDSDRLDLLQASVEQAVAALRDLEEEAAGAADSARVGSELTQALTSALDLDDTLDRICQVISETTAATKCFLFLAEEEGRLALRGRAGVSPEEARRLREELGGLARRVRDSGSDEPYLADGAELAATRRRGFRSVLAVPFTARGRRLGALVALSRQQHAFGLDARERLVALASQAAAEVQALLLQETAQRRLTEVSQLNWLGGRVSNTLDLEGIAQTVAASAAEMLRVPRVALFLASAEGTLQPLRRGQIGFPAVRTEGLPGAGHLGAEALAAQTPLTFQEPTATSRSEDPLVRWMDAPSVACAPMVAPQGLRGLFVVADDVPRTFALYETSLLATYAHQAALALQSAQLYRQAVQRVNRLSRLGEASEALAAAQSPHQSADILLHSAIELFDCPVGFVYVMDPESNELALTAMHGAEPEEWALERIKPGEGLPGQAVQSGRVLISADVTRDGRIRHRQLARELGLGAAIAAPLVSQGRVMGVLTLYRKSPAQFEEEDQRLLISLTANAAMAIESSNQARERKQREEFVSAMMTEVNHRMRNSLQMIIGLLSMETERPGRRTSEEVVRRAISHIQAIAAVQDAIREPEVYKVDVKDVAQRVVGQHRGLRERHIDVHVGGTRVMLPSQRAVHVALVLNELTDNAVRHGFPAGTEGGRIAVSLAEGGRDVVIQVRDTGVGVSKDFDPEAGPGLGLKIVRGLVEQELGGRLEFESRNGFTVRARFPKLD